MPTDRWRYLANCFFRFPGIDKSGNDESYRVGLVLGWKRNTKLDTLWARKRKKKREREIKGELGKGEDVSRKRWSSILTMTLQQPNISQFHARFRYAYKFSAAIFFSLFLSSHLLPRSRRFANFYNLPAADTARAITFERISRNGEMNTRAKERLRLSLRAN